MDIIFNILIVLSFLVESAVLVYCEKCIWKTLYTPLNFLILPYILVLFITILISGRFGFVEFYYPTILLWNVGLLVFFIPSFVLGFLFNKKYNLLSLQKKGFAVSFQFDKVAQVFIILLILLFLFPAQTSNADNKNADTPTNINLCIPSGKQTVNVGKHSNALTKI